MPRTSIILVNYYSESLIRRCLTDILRCFSDDFDVIISDNGSHELQQNLLRNQFGDAVSVIHNRGNLGFGAACNIAASHSSADRLLFVNPDVRFHSDVLGALLRHQAQSLFPESTLGVLLTDRRGSLTHSFGSLPSLFGDLYDLLRNPERRRSAHHKPFSVGYATGAVLLVSRAAFWSVGGFDERFFLYFEEADLQKSLQDAGLPTFVVPTISAIHGGSEIVGPSSNKDRLFFRSKLAYYRKHYSRAHYVASNISIAFVQLGKSVMDLAAADVVRLRIHVRGACTFLRFSLVLR